MACSKTLLRYTCIPFFHIVMLERCAGMPAHNSHAERFHYAQERFTWRFAAQLCHSMHPAGGPLYLAHCCDTNQSGTQILACTCAPFLHFLIPARVSVTHPTGHDPPLESNLFACHAGQASRASPGKCGSQQQAAAQWGRPTIQSGKCHGRCAATQCWVWMKIASATV
jgi:hypothetical protein